MWQVLARPKIRAYYDEILADFSVNDVTHTLHYLLKILENMQRLDEERPLRGRRRRSTASGVALRRPLSRPCRRGATR